MGFENYWGISRNSQNDLEYTDNIYVIMEEQAKYLYQYTAGKVFAIFSEIDLDGSVNSMAKAVANIYKSISGRSRLQETVSGLSTKKLIDANAMYFDKRYGFEICTEKYRFRLFELRMTPIYPVEIIIDEGICKNIGNTLTRIAVPMEKFNHFKLNDEETFCNVLKHVLQDKKVHYIIGELQKRVQDENEKEEDLLEKIIICEGQTEEIILQAIAQKLNQKVTILAANGKHNVPSVFNVVKAKNNKSNILIVVDSDGDEEETKNMIVEKMGDGNYELVIIDNGIEEWFMPKVANFSKLKLIQSIDEIIEQIDFADLSKKYKSFATVLEFLQK